MQRNWLKTSDGSHTDRFKYGYDRNSSRLYRDNLLNDSFDELYHANGASAGYDQLNQLTDFRRGPLSDTNSDNIPDTVTSPTRQQGWDFDALGNFDTQTTDGTPQTRTHNKQNQSTVVGGNNLTFDANGNTTKDETGKQFSFDAWNRLVLAKDSGGSTIATYNFDALGRRIVETVSGTTRDIFFSPGWQVIEEQISGTARTQYVWSPVYIDALIARDRDADGNGSLEERLYAQQDANFNVTAVINTSGTVVERDVYDPYGTPTFLTASWTTLSASAYAWTTLHQGGRFEPVTGLYLFRHRDYSPTLGRWLEVDPIGFGAGDTHHYRFVSNAPLQALDPSGLADIPGVSPEQYELINKALKGQITFQQLLKQVPRDVLECAAKFYDNPPQLVDKGEARLFNKSRARFLRQGGQPPGNLRQFEARLRSIRNARGIALVRLTLRVSGAGVLIEGMIWAVLSDETAVPPEVLGLPHNAELLQRYDTLSGERQRWRMPDGRIRTIEIPRRDRRQRDDRIGTNQEEPRPPDSTLIRRELTLSGERQWWRLPDGKIRSIEIPSKQK